MTTIQKRWFHGTTKENWKKIKKEGLKSGTFLARNLEDLWFFFTHSFPSNSDMFMKCEVILSVKYTPNVIDDDYYKEGASRYKWELVVEKPIPADNIRPLFYI